MKDNPFSGYTTEMLKVFSNEITDKKSFEDDHPLRVICKNIYGNFTPFNLMSLSVHLAQELASRVEEIDLTRKLSFKEKESLLYSLLGFTYEGDVLYDDYGDEFYDNNSSEWHFNTLKNILAYKAIIDKREGRNAFKREIKRLFNI